MSKELKLSYRCGSLKGIPMSPPPLPDDFPIPDKFL